MTERERVEEIKHSIATLEAQRAILGDVVVDSAIVALRKELAALEAPPRATETRGGEEQRKQVTVFFADVSGFTAMSETMDAEDVRDTMNDLWTRLDGAITGHGGLIDKHIGDAVMALFGAPTAREDDPERSIRAALAMQKEIAEFRVQSSLSQVRDSLLAIRIGIHTGPVLLGEVGTTGEYTAMGDTVNLASRLEHAAPVGGILISHDTYRHVRGIFDVQPLEPIQVKGKQDPIQVYVVRQVKARPFRVTTRGIEGIETHMIGRDLELRQLEEALHAVVEDREAQVVTIVGEAGVGKSRLLHEFRNWLNAQPESAQVFRGRATQEMSNLPYSLIRDLFASRFEIRISDPATVARRKLERGIVSLLGAGNAETVEKAHFIGQLIGFDFSESPHLRSVAGDAQQVHDRAFHYIAQLFTAIASFPPTPPPRAESRVSGIVAIYLDDIHWADDGSLDLINYLARECQSTPLLIVALTRSVLFERRPRWDEGRANHIRLELRPLSKRHSRRLVGEILQKVEQVPPDLRDLIVDGAEGNPFYVEELVKVLVEDGVIAKGAEQWQVKAKRLTEIRIPSTLTGVLQARLDQLPSVERETLQRASVVGRIFWDDIVERIAESASRRVSGSTDEQEEGKQIQATKDDDLAAGEKLQRQRLVKLRQILDAHFGAGELRTLCFDLGIDYDDLPAEGRANKARELVTYLEQQGRVSEIVRVGQQLRPDISWSDVLEAAPTTPSAHQEREDVTRSALQAAREKELIFERGVSAFAGTQEYTFKHAILRDVTYESVLRRLRRMYHVQVAIWLIEQSGERVGEYAGLIGEHYERAGQRAQAAEWYGRAGRQAQETYALQVAASYYQKALAVEERWKWRRGQVEVLHILGRRDAERAGLQVLEADAQAPAFEAAYLRGQYHEAVGEYQQAQAAVERALTAARNLGDRVNEARALAQRCLIARRQGDYEGAKACYNQSVALLQDRETRSDEEVRTLAQALNGLGTVHRQQGSFDDARVCYEQALELSQAGGDRRGEAKALDNLGSVAYHQRNFVEAIRYHQQALEIQRAIGDRSGEGTSLSNLAPILQETGDYGGALEHMSAALTIQRAIGNRWEEANILNGLGIMYHGLGDLTSARARLQQGLDLSEEIGDEAGQAYVLANLGLVASDSQDMAAAERYLADGLVIAQEQDDRRLVSYFLEYMSIANLRAGRLEQAIERARASLASRREMDMRLTTTGNLAILAAAYLSVGDTDQALTHARQALSILEECRGEGPEFPQRDYFMCYQVLSAAGEGAQSKEALRSAHRLVVAQADKIANLALRQSFLERVRINREIMHEYERVMHET